MLTVLPVERHMILRELIQERASQRDSIPDRQVIRTSRSHLLTVVLEDYFHVAPLKSVVSSDRWYRFERRVEKNTRTTLDLLDEFGISATFFVLGSIADEMPEIVREVVDRGHEVASKGYFHKSIHRQSPSEFRDDLVRSREAIERASGTKVNGFRIGHQWFGPRDLWALDILASEGFAYDSSVRPLFRRFAPEPWRLVPHRHRFSSGEIWEFPLVRLDSWRLVVSNLGRQLLQAVSPLVHEGAR